MVYEPGKPGQLREIDNTLEACPAVVDGYIETVRLTSELLVICNEEGRLMGLPENRLGICGTFFVCGTAREDFRGLTAQELTVLKRFLH